MDKTTFEEIERGKKYFLIFVITISAIIGIIIGMFTNYKSEILTCIKAQDKCFIEKTNYLNIKSKKELVNISDIKYATYIPKNVAGNMYASGYSAFYLAFYTKEKKSVKIFSAEYYEKDEVKQAVSDLNEQLKTLKTEFKLERSL